MQAKLDSEDGKALYALRQQTIEPVFGQIKEQQGARRFLRRGLAACDAEWKLLCGTHYPEVAVMPRWWRLPLVGGVFGLAWSA